MLIFFGLSRNLITTALRDFFAFIDSIAFTVFGWILQVIFDIANADIVQDGVFDSLQNRIYIFLGIFMLFKVTVSLLSYLVSPDKIADKEKGMGKMVTRTVVVLIMLIGFPAVFNLMQSVQEDLLEALPRIIIGRNTSTESTGEEMDGISDSVSWSVFQLSLGEGDADLMCPDPSDSSTCINTVEGAASVISDPADGNNSEFKYQYKIIIGALIAILMTVLLVGIAIDVAIRAFKLLILRMIAPIPIISYIDPKSSKDGAFASWTKLLISTWLDLFIKLGVLYLVLYLLDEIIIQGGLSIGATLPFFRRLVLIVFLIIGLFFFAKQAPKFISKALGIKEGGGFGVGLGGVLAGAGAAVGGAGLVGALTAGTQAMNENADAAAQGKPGTAGWGKGSDLAAQLRTGDKNAKGGLANRLSTRLNERATARAGDERADKLGLSASNVKELKNEMEAYGTESQRAQDAFAEYQTGVQSGKYEYDPEIARNLQQNARAASQIYSDAKDAYEKAKSARDSLVPKSTAADNYSKKPTYQAIRNSGGKGNYNKGITTKDELNEKIASNIHSKPEKYRSYTGDAITPKVKEPKTADAQNAANTDRNENNQGAKTVNSDDMFDPGHMDG